MMETLLHNIFCILTYILLSATAFILKDGWIPDIISFSKTNNCLLTWLWFVLYIWDIEFYWLSKMLLHPCWIFQKCSIYKWFKTYPMTFLYGFLTLYFKHIIKLNKSYWVRLHHIYSLPSLQSRIILVLFPFLLLLGPTKHI